MINRTECILIGPSRSSDSGAAPSIGGRCAAGGGWCASAPWRHGRRRRCDRGPPIPPAPALRESRCPSGSSCGAGRSRRCATRSASACHAAEGPPCGDPAVIRPPSPRLAGGRLVHSRQHPPFRERSAMSLEQQLRVPGPTPLPARVVRAQSRPMINHRGPEFAELMSEVCSGIKEVLRTENDVLLFPASGTGGLEAAVVNLLSPGERALFCTVGSFGDRWADIAAAYGVDVVRLKMPAGEAIDPEDVERILAENPEIEKVFVTHNETSTGVTNDLPAIASVAKSRGKLIAVDSVSGASCLPLEVDGLKLDVTVTGSQKGWMAPPGLTMVAVSPAGERHVRDPGGAPDHPRGGRRDRLGPPRPDRG